MAFRTQQGFKLRNLSLALAGCLALAATGAAQAAKAPKASVPAAAKAAAVTLLELRVAMALGGKAFVTMTGDVGSVQSAMAAGRALLSDAGVLVNAVMISRPHPDVYHEVI